MKTSRLGRAALEVSRLCLGTMNFGAFISEDESFALMDRALDIGVNFFDLANIYGRPLRMTQVLAGDWGDMPNPGITETIVGNWFAKGGGRRDRVVLATKVYGRMSEGPNGMGLSALHIVQSCENSLRRLRTDRIDLLQFHHVDRAARWEEIWAAIDLLVRQGKILYTGSSNFAGWHIVQANEAASRRSSLGLLSEQSVYNLCVRAIERDVVPACGAYGVGLVTYSPLAGGLLGAFGGEGGVRSASEGVRRAAARFKPQLEGYEGLCRELGRSPADVALQWVLGRPGVSSMIIGPRVVAQLEASARAAEQQLDEETLSRLDELWPGPAQARSSYDPASLLASSL